MAAIQSRKSDHIAIAASGNANHEKTTLLEEVHLSHHSLPECNFDDIDMSCQLMGFKLKAPLMISGMTGGTKEAGDINRALAKAAQKHGLAMGLGSQRAMVEDKTLQRTYDIKSDIPDFPLFGNLGVVQAKAYGVKKIENLAQENRLDGLCIHLNPAQEMVQRDGDREFVGCVAFLQELKGSLSLPLVVKETGAGMDMETLNQLSLVGIKAVDVSGSGGTSWTAVESLRDERNGVYSELGKEFWNWGCPTAVSVVAAAKAGFEIIASGGVRTGLDIAKSLSLGAHIVGMAQPFLKAYKENGDLGLDEKIVGLIRSLQTSMLLTGSKNLKALRDNTPYLGPNLQHELKVRGLQPFDGNNS